MLVPHPALLVEAVEAIINNLRRDSQINEAIVLERKDEPDNAPLFTPYKTQRNVFRVFQLI